MFNEKDKLIFSYSSEQAENEGILFDITKINPEWKQGLFNYVTTNLLSKGYMKKDSDEVNLPNLLDLLNQAMQIVKLKSKKFKEFDHFFNGAIEFPDGEKQEIFISQNETGKFTIMLPEDY